MDLGDFCIDGTRYSKLWNFVECQTNCPAACEWTYQKACSAGHDDVTGCPLRDLCRAIDKPCDQIVDDICTIESGGPTKKSKVDHTYKNGESS